jgi:hypothetical protein
LRRVLIVAALLAVFGAAILAGIAVSSRLAPERLRAWIEARASEQLGPVEIAGLRPWFGWGIGVELSSVCVGPAGCADQIWLTLSTRSLLRGTPRVRRIDVRGLDLHATQKSDGTWEPPLLARALTSARAGDASGAASADLRATLADLPALSLEDANARIERSDGRRLVLRDAQLSLVRDPLGGPPQLRSSGRLGDAAHDAGAFELVATLEAAGPEGDLAFTDVDLAAIARDASLPLDLAGRASGVLTWRREGALDVEAVFADLRIAGRESAGETASSFATSSARLAARSLVGAERITVRAFDWSSDTLKLDGHAHVARPVGEASELAFELRGEKLDVAVLRDLARRVAPEDEAFQRNLRALRGGRIESLSLGAGAVSVAELRSRRSEPMRLAEDLALEATLSGVELQPSDGGAPIRELSGHFSVGRDRLRIAGARARIGDRPLPQLDLSVQGLRALAVALEAGEPLPAVPPLPGIVTLDRWIASKRRPGAPPRWRRIDVNATWIEHPVLLRGLEDVRAVLEPANPGVHIREVKGFWGGVPFEGKGSYFGGEKSRIDVDVSLALPRRKVHRRGAAEPWGRLRFRYDLEKLGDFQAESVDGVADGIDARVEVRRAESRLRPRGDLRGDVDIDLSRSDRVPYRAQLALAKGSLSDLMNDLKMDGGAARGTVELDGKVTGSLALGQATLFEDMAGDAVLRLLDGEIHQRMNVLLAIAAASDTLNPFRSLKTIPYERIETKFRLADGIAATDGFSLQGPSLRMIGTGRVDLVGKEHLFEAVLGIFYFRTLDRVIGVFPILNRMLLGPDENLISTYFALNGPWGEPDARLIPVKSFASGPASFVLEGFPAFVRGGLSAIERMFGPSEPRDEPEPEPPKPSVAPPADAEPRP